MHGQFFEVKKKQVSNVAAFIHQRFKMLSNGLRWAIVAIRSTWQNITQYHPICYLNEIVINAKFMALIVSVYCKSCCWGCCCCSRCRAENRKSNTKRWAMITVYLVSKHIIMWFSVNIYRKFLQIDPERKNYSFWSIYTDTKNAWHQWK